MVDLAEDMRTDFAVVPHQAVSSQGKAATAQQAMAAGQPAAAAADSAHPASQQFTAHNKVYF